MSTLEQIETKIEDLIKQKEALLKAKIVADVPVVTQKVGVVFTMIPTKYKVYGVGIALALLFLAYYVHQTSVQASNLALAAEHEKMAVELDKAKAQFQADIQKERDDHEKIRAEQDAKILALTLNITKRNTNTDKAIANIKTPKTAVEVAKDTKEVLGVEPVITTSQTLAFTLQQTQDILALRLDRDRLQGNLIDTQAQLSVKDKQIATLLEDQHKLVESLTQANETIKQYQIAMQDYKKAAKKSFLQKVGGFVRTMGEVALAAGIVGLIVK